ncbi:MAG TPA: glycosyltransferase [Bacteroidales bacterium]|nr:glycosyltransferase [Bacteroidales bacterium]
MRIFVLLSRVPYPIEKGDKLRAFHQLRCLSKKHEIILVALNQGPVDEKAILKLKEFCHQVHVIRFSYFRIAINLIRVLFTGQPFQVGYFYNRKARLKIRRILAETRPQHIFCQLLRVAEYVRHVEIPKTIDYQDVFSMGMKRRAETSAWWLKPLMLMEYKRLLHYEKVIFNDFENKTIISVPDRDLIPHPDKEQIVVVPNGVDHSYFKTLQRKKTHDIVFTGNMGYPPNVNAAEYLVSEIIPLVRRKVPGVSVMLAGANPHPRVQALSGDKIRVTGWVEDMRESYASSRIFIAPMRIGTGLQNKLLEAMSMGLPCITSVLANQALGAAEGSEILVGRSPEEFAGHIVRLLTDEDFALTVASNGKAFVQRTYDWENSTLILEKLICAVHVPRNEN